MIAHYWSFEYKHFNLLVRWNKDRRHSVIKQEKKRMNKNIFGLRVYEILLVVSCLQRSAISLSSSSPHENVVSFNFKHRQFVRASKMFSLHPSTTDGPFDAWMRTVRLSSRLNLKYLIITASRPTWALQVDSVRYEITTSKALYEYEERRVTK
jgi:hypothetical protein